MIVSILLLLLGFALVIVGADRLVKGASSLASIMKVPEIVIGLTVVAFGTSAPELIVNIVSSAQGHGDIVFGNVIGSNIFNLLLILGVAGLVRAIPIRKSTLYREIPLSLFVAVVLYILVNDSIFNSASQNVLSLGDGLILLVLFAFFMFYTHRLSKGEAEKESIHLYTWWLSLIWILAGLVALVFGGKLVVNHAVNLAGMIGISQKVIGLTIVAAGTSLPELATSIVAAYHKRPDIAIGNVIGSNIFNILFILGISAVIRPTAYNPAFNLDIIVLVVSTLALILLIALPHRHSFRSWKAAIFLMGYTAYLVYMINA